MRPFTNLLIVMFFALLALTGCGGGGGGSAASAQAQPPVISTATVGGLTKAGSTLTFSATATDPANLTLTYAWNFGDSQVGNGASTAHTYSSSGTYAVNLTVTNTAGLTATRTLSVTISALTPTVTSATATSGANIGSLVSFNAAATDPSNLALTYVWSLGDGSPNQTGASILHIFNASGTYNAVVTATNTSGQSDSRSISIPVSSVVSKNPIADCSGVSCAAASSGNVNTYAGSGTGVWRFDNPTSAAASRDINIQGVTAGKTVTLIYANSSESTNASSAPSSGTLASPVEPAPNLQASAAEHHQHSAADSHRHQHGQMLDKNRRLALDMRNEKASRPASPSAYKSDATPSQVMPAVVQGDARVWNENAYTFVNYSTTAKRVCPAGTLGRKVVIWVHTSAYLTWVSDAELNAYQARFCGTNNNDGAYAKIANAIGDAWGSVPSQYSATRIADTVNQKQDVNIVIMDPGFGSNWGGYFYSLNNRLKSTSPSYALSNEALVFFINARQSQNYTQSVLIHELTHMINYYQRTVLKDDIYESWLEETTAMMTQDIFDPGLTVTTVNGSCLPIVCDLQSYAKSGAGISYFNWPTDVPRNHYYMGASFGAFLNRRFGPNIYLQLATDCYTAPANTSGYVCLDMLIKNNGGAGIETEFARFGASVFGRMGGTGEPVNFGFPAKSGSVTLKTSNGAGVLGTNFVYNLPAINNWWSGLWIPAATPLASYTYSTHTYTMDTVANGKTSYVRTGVSVPAKTSLSVVVK